MTTIKRRLVTGDYSLPLFDSRVAVSRKSLADLYLTLADKGRRLLFEAELGRLAAMEVGAVIVEEDWRSTIPITNGYLSRSAVRAMVEDLQDEFEQVMWGFPNPPGRRGGEVAVFLFLLGFLGRGA